MEKKKSEKRIQISFPFIMQRKNLDITICNAT